MDRDVPWTLRGAFGRLWDLAVMEIVRGVVEAVRYQPQHMALVVACGAAQPEVPRPIARWWAEVRVRPPYLQVAGLPHAFVRRVAALAARSFGPTSSALVRWSSGAVAAAADRAGAHPIERALR